MGLRVALLVISLVNGYLDVHIVQNTPNCTPNMAQYAGCKFKLIKAWGNTWCELVLVRELLKTALCIGDFEAFCPVHHSSDSGQGGSVGSGLVRGLLVSRA